jgi:hypothetical protein
VSAAGDAHGGVRGGGGRGRDGADRPDSDEAFTEPWQARIFATAVLTCEQLGLPWDVFRDQLKAAVAEEPDRSYFESFTAALERVVGRASEEPRARSTEPDGARPEPD